MDILIQNVTVLDGSGAPAYAGAIGMENGKLRMFKPCEAAALSAEATIDGTGLTAVPGFIDAHLHIYQQKDIARQELQTRTRTAI